MTVLLVRHALLDGSGSDMADRDLSERGLRQAQRLAEMLSQVAFERIISSSATACVQTVQPVATARQLTVETDALLDSDPIDVDGLISLLLAGCPAGVLACAGGDVIAALLERITANGCEIVLPDGDTTVRWEKGSTWVLDCEGTRLTRATYVPPPQRSATPGAHTHPSFTANAPRPAGSP